MFYRKNVTIVAYDTAAINYVTVETNSGNCIFDSSFLHIFWD